MRFLSSIRILRVALALAVAFWMAGAGCMLGCGNMANAATVTPVVESANPAIVVASDGACASRHSHECCAGHRSKVAPAAKRAVKAQENEATPAATLGLESSATSTMMDCPLAINATAALSKASPDNPRAAASLTDSGFHLPGFLEQVTALAPRTLLPNRGHTYLRHCVFLI